MANIKLKNNYWVTESIYDTTDSKTQKQVNADLHQDISDLNGALNNINIANAQIVSTANTDLNNYTDGGVWFFPTAYAPTGKPSASGSYGFLIVAKGRTTQRLMQIWIDSSTSSCEMWYRANSASPINWSTWKRFANDTDIQSLSSDIGNVESTVANIDYSDAQNVSETKDLDACTTGGIWFFGSSYTPTHKPESSRSYGFLIVMKGGSNQRLIQFWIDSSTAENRIWFRANSYNPVAFDSWKRILTSNDDTVSIGGADSAKIKRVIQEIRTQYTLLSAIDYEKVKNEVGYLPQGDYQGVPYADAYGIGNDIFYNRNLSTFFSAMRNPASLMYMGHIQWGSYSLTNYGAVCSTFAGWLHSIPIFYGCDALSQYEVVEFYDYNGVSSIKIGDCLLTPEGGGAHIITIYDIEVDRDTFQPLYIDTIEQTSHTDLTGETWCRISRLSIAQFEAKLVKNGGNYQLARYKNGSIVDIDPVVYATDIIPDKGDRTYYDANEEVWIYISNSSTSFFYKTVDATTFTEVQLSTLTSKTVNNVVVYNISSIISQNTKYVLTTNIDNFTKCEITRINTGTITISGSNVTLSGYSTNITPIWTQTLTTRTTTPAMGRWQANLDGYYAAERSKTKKEITTDTFTTTKPSTSGYGYQVLVYYETGCGQAMKASSIVWT